MNAKLLNFSARFGPIASRLNNDRAFNEAAVELFALQYQHNPAYRKICEGRNRTPDKVEHWTRVPFVPTAIFKELELSSIPPPERTAVFHSSGTMEQKPSRHFHSAESLAVYEESLRLWFDENIANPGAKPDLLCLTPPPQSAPHSSLVHMLEIVRQKWDAPDSVFTGKMAADNTWILDFDATIASLQTQKNKLILGTAFSFVHLLDYLAEKDLRFELPPRSRVMETGGYKNRSRMMPKVELHSLMTKWLGISRENIICEYGMSELSSQAYDTKTPGRYFHFPPWARLQIISPETGREVAEGETGLIRIFDLANVFSVAAIQTEDLGVRRRSGFDLIGRATLAEARGCSLMTA